MLKWWPVVAVVMPEKRTSAVLPPSWQWVLFGQEVNGRASYYAAVAAEPF